MRGLSMRDEHTVSGATATPSITLRGTVETLFYSGATFSAGKLRAEDGSLVSFAGKLFVQQGDPVVLVGKWGTHPKYGTQFEVSNVEFNHSLDVDGLARYLAGNPALVGIGPVKARQIAERCGGEFDRIITDDPETLAKSVKVPLDTIRTLRAEWLRTKALNAAATWLASFDLTHHQITTLVEKLGNNVRAILEADPYMLVGEIRGLGFKRVDHIARAMGTRKDHPGRIRAGLLHCVDDAIDSGHTWVEYEDLVTTSNTLLVLDALDSRARIEATLDLLIGEGTLSATSPGDRLLITRPEMRAMEEALAGIFRRAADSSPAFKKVDDLAELITRTAPTLNEDQRGAVEMAISHSISLLSGGAGSGKTYTVASLVRIAEEQHLTVTLCAPTGKAAKRLEEVVGRPASTIHRLLGYDGKNYHHGPERPIVTDVLIVDEVSMVDVPLAHRLFAAADLTRTSILLVGDHNQLPPVGPGNILRDLIQARAIPMTILDKIVRQAGVLKTNSIAVLHGEVRRTSGDETDGRRPWYIADQFTDALAARRFVEDLFTGILSERLYFNLLDDVQLLTPTHKGPLGTIELNILLQRVLQKKLHGVDVPAPAPGRRAKILPRDKVIQTRNDYELGVMNGAIGTVEDVTPHGATVRFEGSGSTTRVPGASLRALDLAYALTIHKVQGSEFPCVVAVIHKAHAFQHHRNLLYTAVTRARSTVILVGDSWGMRNCAARRSTDQRRTFLPYLLPRGAGEKT